MNHKKMPPPLERGVVLIGSEFTDIIFKKNNRLRRPIPIHAQLYVKASGKLPDDLLWQYQKGTVLFVREAFRPERKPNGDIYRHLEDKDTFVPPQMTKWKKIRWHSAFSMKKSDCRLFLKIARFRLNIKSMTMTISVEIDRVRSKSNFWPKKSQLKSSKKRGK